MASITLTALVPAGSDLSGKKSPRVGRGVRIAGKRMLDIVDVGARPDPETGLVEVTISLDASTDVAMTITEGALDGLSA